jgi:hypothetical protein
MSTMDFLRRRLGRGAAPDPDRLERFLTENELDDLRPWPFEQSTRAEQRRIREVVEAFAPLQAMYNLLLHPMMLPPDVRFETVARAIAQHESGWLALAAVVGLQGWPREAFGEGWPYVREALLALVTAGDPVVANRATVTLAGAVGPGDGPAVAAVLRAEPAGAEARNLLLCLLRCEADEEITAMLPLVLPTLEVDSGSRAWLDSWVLAGRRPASPPPGILLLPGLGYIPNLTA